MDETRLRTIEQLQQFLSATPEVRFTAPPAGSADYNQRYEHISRVLARFDYPQRNKRERGVVLAYLRRTSGLWPRPAHPPSRALGAQPARAGAAALALPRPSHALRTQVHGGRRGAAGRDGSGP